jgi:hypothetical protein
MRTYHKKIYYVGGLISLIVLPTILLLSTIEARRQAKVFHKIEVNVHDPYALNKLMVQDPPESLYVFIGANENIQLENLKQFCETHQQEQRYILKGDLPKNCSYNFVIKMVDIFQCHQFVAGIDKHCVRFKYCPQYSIHSETLLMSDQTIVGRKTHYYPRYNPQEQIQHHSLIEKIQYGYSRLSLALTKIWDYCCGNLKDQPLYSLSFTNEVPAPRYFDGYQFIGHYSNSKEEEIPQSELYFSVIDGSYFLLLCVWVLLFILTILRSIKLIVVKND